MKDTDRVERRKAIAGTIELTKGSLMPANKKNKEITK